MSLVSNPAFPKFYFEQEFWYRQAGQSHPGIRDKPPQDPSPEVKQILLEQFDTKDIEQAWIPAYKQLTPNNHNVFSLSKFDAGHIPHYHHRMKLNLNKCMLGILELTGLRYPLNKFNEPLEFGQTEETKPTLKVQSHLELFQIIYQLTENYAPPTTPTEAAKKKTSAGYKPAYPPRTFNQQGETANQLSHGGAIVLPPTHYLCHFTLSFGKDYQRHNSPGPPDIPFNPLPFGSSKASPVERKKGYAVNPTTNIDKPWANQRRFSGLRGRNYRGQNCPGPPGTLTEKYAPRTTPLDPTTNIEEPYTSQRHFAEIFRQHDLGKPWTDQRRFTGFRGRNYRGQNCPGPPGTLTKKCTPLAIPMEAAREASSAKHRPTNTLRKPDQRWELVNQLSHRRIIVLSPTSNRREKTNDPLYGKQSAGALARTAYVILRCNATNTTHGTYDP